MNKITLKIVMVSLKRLNSFTRKIKEEKREEHSRCWGPRVKKLWRDMTDVKVSEAGAEWDRKRRQEAGGRQKPDSVGPCQGVPDLCFKSRENH